EPGVTAGADPDQPAAVPQRCFRLELAQAECLGEGGRFQKRALRTGLVTGPRLRVSEREKQVAPPLRVSDAAGAGGVQCKPVQTHRLLVRKHVERMVARSARIRDRLLQVIAAGGFDEV